MTRTAIDWSPSEADDAPVYRVSPEFLEALGAVARVFPGARVVFARRPGEKKWMRVENAA